MSLRISYEEAFKIDVKLPKQISSSELNIWPEGMAADRQTLLKSWLSVNSGSLEQLKLGSKKAYYWNDYQGSSMVKISPSEHMAKLRNLTYALCVRAKLNAAKGNFKEAFSDLLACYHISKHLTGPKTSIEQLTGIIIKASASQAGFQILDRTKPNPDYLENFQEGLRKLCVKQERFFDFTYDKFFVYDNIQTRFTDDGKGGGRIPKLSAEQLANLPEYLVPLLSNLTEEQRLNWINLDRRHTTDLTHKLFEYLNLAVSETPVQLHSKGKNPEKVVTEIIKANLFLSMFTPDFVGVLQVSSRRSVETEALIATIALLRYKDNKGRFPTTLQELVSSGYLKKIPANIYSDGPLIYRPFDDNFMLYSFGADFDNDGGVQSNWGQGKKGGDRVFWPRKRQMPRN